MSDDGYSYSQSGSTVNDSVAESVPDADPDETPAAESEQENPEPHHEEEEEKHWSQEDGRQKVFEMLQSGEITFPVGFSNDDLLAFLESIEVPQEFNQEAVTNYHQECVNLIKEELVPDPEKPEEDDEDVVNLTPEFIAERLSDLQPVEGEHLSFAFSSFAVQEAEIFDIKALADFHALLFISLKNNIVSDASGLSGLPRLRELRLSENKLVSFTGISLPALEVLDLSQNKLRTLGCLSLPKLKRLILSQNQICFISPQAFIETTELEELNLAENRLKMFKGGTFQSLAKLTLLKLDQNTIGDIVEGFFDGLVGLKKLELGENPVDSIPGLSVLTALEHLDMHQASVMKLEDLRPLIDLKALKSVNLDGAPVDGMETFKSDMILMLPWLETIDEEQISFSDRQEALALDEERKAEAERLRLEAEQEAAEREAKDSEQEESKEGETGAEEDKSEAGTEETAESYSTYDSS